MRILVGAKTEAGDVEEAFEAGHTRALKVAHEVTRRIVRLELAPGEAITEGELAEEADTSKPTAREALQWVMFQGLVTPRRGSGYIVNPITLRDAKDLLEWWRISLTEAAALAARAGLPDKHAEKFRGAAKAGKGPFADAAGASSEVVRDFFVVIVHPNRAVHRATTAQLYPMARLERLANRDTKIVAAPSILAVLDAIEAKDEAQARQQMQARTRDFETKVVDALITLSAVQDANLTGEAS